MFCLPAKAAERIPWRLSPGRGCLGACWRKRSSKPSPLKLRIFCALHFDGVMPGALEGPHPTAAPQGVPPVPWGCCITGACTPGGQAGSAGWVAPAHSIPPQQDSPPTGNCGFFPQALSGIVAVRVTVVWLSSQVRPDDSGSHIFDVVLKHASINQSIFLLWDCRRQTPMGKYSRRRTTRSGGGRTNSAPPAAASTGRYK